MNVLEVKLDRKTGKLAYRIPGKGARWRSGFDDMSALSQDAMKELNPPWVNEFVDDDAQEEPATKPRKRA